MVWLGSVVGLWLVSEISNILPTLVSDPKFIHLATGLSVYQTGLSVKSIRLVPNMDFQTVRDDSPTVQEVLQYRQ